MPAASSLNVLIVDDQQTIRSLVRSGLQQLGFTNFQDAADGEDGLRAMLAKPYSLVISDYNMPNLDGPGFIERVRQHPEHRATPILVLTTESDPTKKARARSAGATGWIIKPFNPDKLVEAIRRVAA